MEGVRPLSLREKFLNKFGLITSRQAKELKKAYRTWEEEESFSDYPSGKERTSPVSSYLHAYTSHIWTGASISDLATTCASVPFKLFKYKNKKEKEEVIEGEIIDILFRPNKTMSFFDLIEGTIIYQETIGDAFWQIDFDEDDIDKKFPRRIFLLRADKVKIRPDPKEFIKEYIYIDRYRFSTKEIVHFRKFNPLDDFYGLSSLKGLSKTIQNDMMAIQWNTSSLKDERIDGYLTTDEEIDPETADFLGREWVRKFSGQSETRRLPVLGKGTEYRNVRRSPKEMEYIEGRKINREEILAGLKVFPIALGLMEGSSYANAFVQLKLYYEKSIFPRLKKLEYQINNQLIWEYWGDNYEFSFDYKSVDYIKEDIKDIAGAVSSLVDRGVFTINEVRQRFFNLGSLDWGEKWYKPMTLEAVEKKETEREKIEEKEDEKQSQVKNLLLKLHSKYEKILGEKLVDVFSDFKKEVITNITIKNLNQEGIDNNEYFDLEKLQKQLREEIYPLQEALINDAIDISALFYPAIEKVEKQDIVATFLQKHIFKFSDEVSTTISNDIKEVLRDTIIDDLPVSFAVDKLENIFAGYSSFDAPRILRIARTELSIAENFGLAEGYKRAGAEKKMWSTTMDSHARASHILANRQVVDIDKPFLVGGYEMMRPGDYSLGAPASEVVNCRCLVLPVF